MSPEQKLSLSKTALQSIQGALRLTIDLHEQSRITLLSSDISDQLGESYATNAFARCRQAIFEYALVRLCALWDKPTKQPPAELTLPTARWLVDDPEVIGLIKLDFEPHERRLGTEIWSELKFRRILERTDRIAKSDLLERVRNYRSKYLAHNLTATNLERSKAAALPLPQYRDVTNLLSCTIHVAQQLDANVTGISYQYGIYIEQSRTCAQAFWLGPKFSGLE